MRKTIALSSLLAASVASANPQTGEEAIQQLTGPNQPATGNYELCLKVNPYFITSLTPTGVEGSFFSMVVSGTDTFAADEKGGCDEVNFETGKCEFGYVKVTSTTPLACSVPIGL